MASIVVVGLGPGARGQVTREAEETIAAALSEHRVLLRTRVHPTVDAWPELAQAPSLDHHYQSGADFGDVYDRIAVDVAAAAERLEARALVYAVPGHPLVGEATVARLRRQAGSGGPALRIVPGLSFVDATLAAVHAAGAGGVDEGLRVADALALGRIDPTVPLLVCQVYSRRIASQVKLALARHYPDEHPVLLVRAAGVPGEQRIETRALFEIDRDEAADHLTSLWVPPLAALAALREPQTLQEVMARLRAPDGCPWDREQTHQSLRKYLLEESYEALEALDSGNLAALEEELGDLLLQIVFHAQIADEEGTFDFGDVVAGISAKLIRRHPHVFGPGAAAPPSEQAADAQSVLRSWEALKRAERAGRDQQEQSMLDGVPRAMPALSYAQAVIDRATRVGFDWPNVEGVLDKVAEEAREVAAAGSDAERHEEVGDLLFVIVCLAAWLKIDAEDALRAANRKFRDRFAAMERAARAAGKTLEQYDSEGLDVLWRQAKVYSASDGDGDG